MLHAGVQPATASQRLVLSAAGAGVQITQIPGPEFYPMEWALNGPKSNLEVGLVPGGKVTAGLMDKRTLLEFDELCLTPRGYARCNRTKSASLP